MKIRVGVFFLLDSSLAFLAAPQTSRTVQKTQSDCPEDPVCWVLQISPVVYLLRILCGLAVPPSFQLPPSASWAEVGLPKKKTRRQAAPLPGHGYIN